jgi:hypothetical protein
MERKGGVWPLTSFIVRKITPRLLRGNFILLVVVVVLSVSFGPTVTFAHPGGTDSSGCHTCRTNCPNWGLSFGEYHCHRSKGVPQPKEPIKSHLNKSGAGYTEPAPEYKTPADFTGADIFGADFDGATPAGVIDGSPADDQ